MFRNKHLRIDQEKIERAKKILKAKTETEALNRALEWVIQKDQEGLQRRKIMKRMVELRGRLGKIGEDPAEWITLARKERTRSYDGGG